MLAHPGRWGSCSLAGRPASHMLHPSCGLLRAVILLWQTVSIGRAFLDLRNSDKHDGCVSHFFILIVIVFPPSFLLGIHAKRKHLIGSNEIPPRVLTPVCIDTALPQFAMSHVACHWHTTESGCLGALTAALRWKHLEARPCCHPRGHIPHPGPQLLGNATRISNALAETRGLLLVVASLERR